MADILDIDFVRLDFIDDAEDQEQDREGFQCKVPHIDFQVRLTKRETGEPLGIDVRLRADNLKVISVRGGLVADWNASAVSWRDEVRVGDRIMEMNGCRGTGKQLVEAMKDQPVLNMVVRRLNHFEVVLHRRADAMLGIHVLLETDHLVVTSVGEGVVAEWNKAHEQEAVLMGDEIFEVNGVYGDSERIKEAIMQPDANLRLLVVRPEVHAHVR